MTAKSPGSLFGTFLSYQERNTDSFFGRADDVARLDQLLTGTAHVIVLSGPSGIGKTSLLRAGLTPALARREMTVVTLTSYRDLERELVRATSIVGIAPPVPGQDAADYLGGVARDARGGLVLILDNLEEVLAPLRGRPDGEGATAVAEMALRVVEEAPRTRIVLSIDDAAFARLDAITGALGGPTGKLGVPSAMTLPRLSEAAVADIIERSAVQSGTPFETGLAAAVAADRRSAAGVAAPLPTQRRPGRAAGAVAGRRLPRGGRQPRAPGLAGRRRSRRRQRIRSRRAQPARPQPRRGDSGRAAGAWAGRPPHARPQGGVRARPSGPARDRRRLRDHRSGARHRRPAGPHPADLDGRAPSHPRARGRAAAPAWHADRHRARRRAAQPGRRRHAHQPGRRRRVPPDRGPVRGFAPSVLAGL